MTEPTVRDRVLLLAAAEVGLIAAGMAIIGWRDPVLAPTSILPPVGYALVLIALGLLPRMYVEFRRHALQLTPSDLVMIIGLFALGPWLFVATGMLAEVVAALRHRQAPLKTAFNLVHLLGGLVATAATFAALGRTDPLDPVAWLAGAAALAACTLWDLVSTAAVLAIAEKADFRTMFARILPTVLAGWVVSALLGIAALVLFQETPFGPLLFAPVLAILVVSTRGVARQQAQRTHFERLYEASSNLTELVGLHDMLGRVATEARSMTTGAVAICSTIGPDGAAAGVLADDQGTRQAPSPLMDALAEVTASGTHGQLDEADLERRADGRLPSFPSLVWAVKRSDGTAPLLLAVFRELPNDDDRQPEILTAFVSHAAALVANVGLHAEVRGALSQQVELNQQKSEFVAAVSHELRTPLATMISSVQTARRLAHLLSGEERDRVLGMGLAEGARLQSLIEDLLLVAAADHRRPEVGRDHLPVAALIDSLGPELRTLLPDRLVVEVTSDAGAVLGDDNRVRRIVLNLVENASKYAPIGPIELTARRGRREVLIAVTDHGPGVPEADRERIFERFVQLDQSSTRRQGGTGLGLYLCRELARGLEGRLSLITPASGGCRFELRLPAAPNVERPEATIPSTTSWAPSIAVAAAGTGGLNP